MPYINHDQIDFHYLEALSGGPNPTTFVFQHGLGGDTERVLELLGLLPGFGLLGLDCRGHGKTKPLGDVEKLSFDSFADDVIALLDRLQVRRVSLGGTSMGAGVANAVTYPSTRKREVDVNLRDHLHRLVVQQCRLIAPLLHCFERRR